MGESLNLSFSELCYHVKSRLLPNGQATKQILKGITGEFCGSELSAVIGPSGSGKSSLLDILSGFKRVNVTGSFALNGASVSTSVVRKVSSYVMQDNKLHGFLTVYETMMFAANFKRKNDREKHKKIEDILSSLGVCEKRFTFVKHLSGGEQKRLSIALELLAEPSIMFLDEPTSGLDSVSSAQCIKLLKQLAEQGKTIVITIHSPSAILFEMFDHLYALADGFCIYQGSNKNLVPFLRHLDLICPESFSPTDFLLEIATNDYGEQNQLLTTSIKNGCDFAYRKLSSLKSQNLNNRTADIQALSSSINLLPFSHQVMNLLHRNFLISKRDKMLVTMRLFIHLAIGLSFGFLYKNVGDEASKFLDNYRYIIATIVFQLYTSYFSLQTASE